MSISPIRSPNLPGPSSFSFFSDKDENQATSSNQELTLKDRIKSVLDRLGYKAYSVLNPPRIKPLSLAEDSYQEEKKKFFAKKPLSYEEAKKRTLAYTKYDRGTWGCDLEIKNVDLYADPEFRKAEVKNYADRIFEGSWPLVEGKDREWCILRFCKKELHALYKEEPKYQRLRLSTELWMLKGHNAPILARHKEKWDQLTLSEKSEKIFGKRWKYEVAVGVSVAVGCFFLCQRIWLGQQARLRSLQQPSTF